MERPNPKFSLDVVQFHAGYCTVNWSFISVPFIGAVGIWWETESHSDKVASSNYFSFPLHIKNSSRTCEQFEIDLLLALSSPVPQVQLSNTENVFQDIHNIYCVVSLFELQISQQLINAHFIIWKQLWSSLLTSPTSFESKVSLESGAKMHLALLKNKVLMLQKQTIISKNAKPFLLNISILIRQISICYSEHDSILNLMQVTWTASRFWMDSRPCGATTKTASSHRLGKPLRRILISEKVTAGGLLLTINGSNIEGVGKEKFLGVHVAEDRNLPKNTIALIKKAQQHLDGGEANSPPCIITTFYPWNNECFSAFTSLLGM